MNILVYDIAAENSGALTVLNDFYKSICKSNNVNVNWIFLLSKVDLQERENIKVLKYPWIKKSWFHRLFFDYFVAPKLIKKLEIDTVFSLQNTLIPFSKIKQVLYLHQSLPYVDYRFKIYENFKFWVYQNIISCFINFSIIKSDLTIVQTQWMKNVCLQKTKKMKSEIIVIPPHIELDVPYSYKESIQSPKLFFYPATANSYKNHTAIIEACKLLEKDGINDYKVIFTLKGNENRYAKMLKEEIIFNNLNIELIGMIPLNEVYKIYSESVLLFPSYVESHPMPLKEASLIGSIIIASNLDFSKEILDHYPNKIYINPFDYNELYKKMLLIYKNTFKYKKVSNSFSSLSVNTWDEIISLLIN